MKNLMMILVVVILGGCVTQKPIKESVKIVERDSTIYTYKDSITYKTVKKDSTIFREGLVISKQIPCTDNKSYLFVRNGDEIQLTIKNGVAQIDVNLKGTESKYTSVINELSSSLSSTKYKLAQKEKSETKVVVSVITHIPWYWKLLGWIGIFYLAVLAFKYTMSKWKF
jgi:hypothetical protein